MGKTAVVDMKDRETNRVTAEAIESADGLTLKEFVLDQVADGAKVYTDEHAGYRGLPDHQAVNHSVKEYVDGQPHTTGSSPSGRSSSVATTAPTTTAI